MPLALGAAIVAGGMTPFPSDFATLTTRCKSNTLSIKWNALGH